MARRRCLPFVGALLRISMLLGLLAPLGPLAPLEPLRAQDEKPGGKKVNFETVDGVELQGTFYAAPQRDAAVVMLLHPLNEDSNKKAWINLAELLHKSGYSVLRFDFRGHGNSTTIDPKTFWGYQHNRNLVKGWQKNAGTIAYKDMNAAYYPTLVNDIAAAKAFLDNRNDAGACNTGMTVLVGADSGATLGAIWLNAECNRFRLDPPLLIGNAPEVTSKSEGRNVIACLWLSLTSKLGARPTLIPMSRLLDAAAREAAIPMVFFHSNEDTAGKTIAKTCVKAIKPKKDDPKYSFTDAVEVKGGKLKGMELLQKSLGVDDAIVTYLKEVTNEKRKLWEQRDFAKTQYVWRGVAGAPVPCIQNKFLVNNAVEAKTGKEKTLIFDTYDKFIPR